ncbi:hypothetical protein AMTRI_Chr09g20050 [Amborella trichopoda]
MELPLFPLPRVLFPGQSWPSRYTDLLFSIIYVDITSGVIDVGCVGEVVKHECLVDARFFLICKGRRKLFPTPFSFFVGSTFKGAPREQQALLELENATTKLKRQKKTLRNMLNYLIAASAVEDAFPSSS